MIERKYKPIYWEFIADPTETDKWFIIHSKNVKDNMSFRFFHFRINGKVYKNNSKSWREAFNKELSWDKLKG